MQFLSDVFIRCPDCNGRRYRPHILEVKLSPKSKVQSPKSEARRPETASSGQESRLAASRITHHASRITHHVSRPFSIADLLDATVEEAIAFLAGFPDPARPSAPSRALKLLEEVGLGYLKLGQPINTLSGGESQRLKLVRHLAEVIVGSRRQAGSASNSDTPHSALRTQSEPPHAGSYALPVRRADHRPALRRRARAAQGLPAAGGCRPLRARHRAQPRRHEVRRLDH